MLEVFFIITFSWKIVAAVDQCPDYRFKSPFLPGDSCESIYNKNPENHDPGYYWILSQEYCGMSYTGSSCKDIYSKYSETHDKSGYYRIYNKDWTYCDMTPKSEHFIAQCGGEGWRRIAHIDINAGDDCPGEWRKATESDVSFCTVASTSKLDTCSSAKFSTNETSYQKVCGKARGYQKGVTWGFNGRRGTETIDGVYAAGLSLTHGSPRQHIWTFVTGFSEMYGARLANCPCAHIHPGPSAPSFVGNNYYCESGSIYHPGTGNSHFNDTLWDGEGCYNSDCCKPPTQPWFPAA